jgi:hypothetical protein
VHSHVAMRYTCCCSMTPELLSLLCERKQQEFMHEERQQPWMHARRCLGGRLRGLPAFCRVEKVCMTTIVASLCRWRRYVAYSVPTTCLPWTVNGGSDPDGHSARQLDILIAAHVTKLSSALKIG